MKTRKNPSLTDKQLDQVLASLRVEVAAPPDFKAQVLKRLQKQGLIQGAPAAAELSLWRRWLAGLSLPRVAGGLSAALVLLLVLQFTVRQPQPVALDMAALPSAAPAAALPAASSHRAPAPAAEEPLLAVRPKSETMPEAIMDEHAAAAPIVGAASVPQPAVSSSLGMSVPAPASNPAVAASAAGLPLPGSNAVSAASVVAKPTVILPTPTPMTRALQGNSELRGNVIHASRGEAAVLLYRVLKSGPVHIEIFDRLGRSITVLKDAELGPGTYELKWGGQTDSGFEAASGIYVLKLHTASYSAQHKLALVK